MKIDFITDINKGYESGLKYPDTDRFMMKVIWWHLAVFIFFAFMTSVVKIAEFFPSPFSWRVISTQEAIVSVSIALVFTLIPLAAYQRIKNHYLWRVLVTCALTLFSYLFVFISGASIEAHFHFFVLIALLVIYADWRLGWILAVLTVVHHGVLNYFQPGWVYFYGKNDFSVVAHALPVLVAVFFTTVLCEIYRRTVVGLVEVEKNLTARTVELQKFKSGLEVTVTERTTELQQKVQELEHLNGLMVDRELKMVELKKTIAELQGQKAIL